MDPDSHGVLRDVVTSLYKLAMQWIGTVAKEGERNQEPWLSLNDIKDYYKLKDGLNC